MNSLSNLHRLTKNKGMKMNRLTLTTTLAAMLAAACFSSAAFAEQGKPPGGGVGEPPRGPNPEMFQKMKTKMLENHQKRIQILQQSEPCIQAATTPGQLKACREKEHQAMEQLREQNKQDRGAMRDQPPPRPGQGQGPDNRR